MIRQLRAQGHTIKEVAEILNISKSKVQREIGKGIIIDNLKNLVLQVIQDLKLGDKSYVFNETQLELVRKSYPHFNVGKTDTNYVLYPKIVKGRKEL